MCGADVVTLRPTQVAGLALVLAAEASEDSIRWLGEVGAAWHDVALRDSDQEHIVILDGEAFVGFVVLAGVSTPRVELRRIVIVEAARGRGLGRLAVRAVLARLPKTIERVWLDVKMDNVRARSLYLSERFEVDRVLEDAGHEPDGTSYSLVLMSRAVRLS